MTPDSPLTTINEAVARARQISSQGRPVQIRVLPGKYHESIVLPPGVAMVNHMGPTGSSPDQRRSWLQGTTQRERNTHVTLTAPDGTCAVTIQNDSQGIIAGIHILGNRENNGPTRGLLIQDCARVKVYLCRIASHYIDADGAAIHLSPKTSTAPCRLLIQDSIIEQNRCTGRGAGIFLDRGLVVVRQSRINENEAGIAGGGLYATNTGDQPLLLEHTVMERNTVYVDGELPKASKEGWFGETGHGGCVFVVGGTLHLKNSDMIANTAHGAGGAIFATHSRVLIEGTEDVLEHLGRLVDNRSVRGGAILMRGGTQAQTTALKIVGAQLTANVAQHSGGAIAAANLVHIEISGTGLHHNKVTGDRAEGGAIHITLGTRARIDTSHLLSNQATFRAGAISACNSSLRLLSGCTLRQNQCTHGDSGAIAHYTMASSHLDLLRQNGHIEEPAVFAMEEVEVESNQAAKAVGGVFVGNYSKEASLPIVVAIRVPGCITQNKVCASDGGQEKPANLLVFWNRAVRANDKHPPDGPLQLK